MVSKGTDIIIKLDSIPQPLLAQQIVDEVVPSHDNLAISASSLCQKQSFFESVIGKSTFDIFSNLPRIIRVHVLQLFLDNALQPLMVALLGDI